MVTPDATAGLLVTTSAATMDRRLAPARAKIVLRGDHHPVRRWDPNASVYAWFRSPIASSTTPNHTAFGLRASPLTPPHQNGPHRLKALAALT